MVHCMNGTIDNLAANEAECFEQLRVVLSYVMIERALYMRACRRGMILRSAISSRSSESVQGIVV
jgi:hypothetical protein